MSSIIQTLMRWARITKAGSDDGQFALQQLTYLGKTADSLIVFPYGLHGNVPVDALALMFSVQGNPDNRAAIAWTPKDRPKLAEGEVAFYHPPTDAFIIHRASGELDIETGVGGTKAINIKCSDLNATCDNINATCDNMNVTATTKVDIVSPLTEFTGTVKANGKVIDDTHGHTQANDSDNDVQAAISGVT